VRLVTGSLSGERGAVVVFVAVLIVPLVLLAAFAIDTGNWWTHKRHLQTQADAAAFAGGQGPWFPACNEPAIEQQAAAYSGGTYNQQYQTSGTVNALLNSTGYSDKGGTSFSDTGTPCHTLEVSDESHPAFLDVKATESGLPNFFGSIPGFSSVNVHTHARVEIQGVLQENGVRPIAVRNPSLYKCAHAQLWTTNGGGSLDEPIGLPFTAFTRTVLSDTSTQFQITGTATMPTKTGSGASNRPHVAVQIILGNDGCAVTDTFADNPASWGVDFINVHQDLSKMTVSGAPALGSVSMPPGASNCDPDPYFAVGSCTATVKAYVKWQSGAKTTDPGKNAFITINDVDASAGSDADGAYWMAEVPVGGESGPNPIRIHWEQTYGSVGGENCKEKGNPKECSGSFDAAQQAFGATNDDDDVNSGDIDLVQVADANGNFANSVLEGTTRTFTITVRVKGLENSKPTDPPTILRNSNQSSKRTGLVECGQGNGASADKDAIVNGCPLGVYIWPEGTPCVLPNNDPIDCVTAIPGNRRQKIASAVKDRIASATTGYGGMPAGCNHWNAYREAGQFEDINNFIDPSDPRVLPLIITEPADLAGNSSGPPIPVRAIATFYVTGYDGGAGDGQGCANEPYPGKKGNDKFQIWGHWIKYVPVGGGIGDGKGCDPDKFGDCIAVLTQ
jgi:Putative Flp pilus-assembly TadE/G-like